MLSRETLSHQIWVDDSGSEFDATYETGPTAYSDDDGSAGGGDCDDEDDKIAQLLEGSVGK
jgi:hypothetical protein